jgi:putative ABC transport system substrate-binding protein
VRRREFIAGVGGAVTWPVVAGAQPSQLVRRVGALIGASESDFGRQTWLAEFRKALQELGWAEGRNIQIDWRWAAYNRSLAKTYAAELVTLKPDVLFGDNTFVVEQLQGATRTLPIVFAAVNNPVLSGFVGSVAYPGGNITGFADSEPSSLAKLVEFIRLVAPQVTNVAIIADDISQVAKARTNVVAAAASSAGLTVTVTNVHDAQEIEAAVIELGREPNGGLIVPGNPTTNLHRKLILTLASRYKLPAVFGYLLFAGDGGLLSYGTKTSDQYRGAAGYIDRILKGARPGELPVQLPTKFELVINLKTANALGLTIPETLLATADELIQ